MKLISITKSSNPEKKYMAVFETNMGTRKTTHFGSANMKDFTLYPVDERQERKRLYLIRHRANENWNDPTTAGALSRWVLWNKPTLKASIDDFKKRFRL
jgi:hypothetical protein